MKLHNLILKKIEYLAPPSKAISQRAILTQFLIESFDYKGLSDADDVNVLISAIDNFKQGKNIRVGESGFSLRTLGILTPFIKAKNTFIVSGTLKKRKLDDLFYFYKTNNISYSLKHVNNEKLLKLNSKPKDLLKQNRFKIHLNVSSQVLSGLLFLSLLKKTPYTIEFNKLISNEYIDLSISFLKKIGIDLKKQNKKIVVRAPKVFDIAKLQKNKFIIEKDWNLSAFFIAFALNYRDLNIKNLSINSIQSSRIFYDILKKSGAKFNFKQNILSVQKTRIKAFHFDLDNYPDLFLPVLFTTVFAQGTSLLTGLNRLKYKESDRLTNALTILDILEISYKLEDSKLSILGEEINKFINKNINKNLKLSCFDDHRMCMFSNFFLLLLQKPISFDICVNKSYPNFFEDLKKINF